jgi:Icc protein
MKGAFLMRVRFGVFADLHVDIMHDCESRLRVFLDACRDADVDFIVQLGDFCYPDEDRKCYCQPDKRPVNIQNAMDYPTYADKDTILSLYRDFEKPSYHVIGNHDLDMCSKEQMMAYYGNMTSPYYSFDCGGVHFVALDCNYCKVDGKYIPYDNGIYFDWSYDTPRPLPYLPPEQLRWLDDDLSRTELPSVLFSHQMLRAPDLKNADELAPILRKHNVILSANGHHHKDNVTRIGSTWFWNVNSMSNYWLDVPYATLRYTPQLDVRYPNIRYVAPYRDPVFAIVTITDGVIDIRGRKSVFVGPSPAEQGFPMKSWEDIVSPSVTDFSLRF